MASKKILIVDPILEGGIAHYSFALCNALAAAGAQVTLATSRGAHELAGLKRRFESVEILQADSYLSHLPPRLTRRIARAVEQIRPQYWHERMGREVSRFIHSQKIQVVHQQWPTHLTHEPSFWASLRRHPPRVPLVYTAHNVWPHEATPTLVDQYRDLYRHPDRLIVHGEMLRRQIIEEAAVPEEKVRVVPHGNYHYLADASAPISQAEARTRLGLPANARVILFFGYIRFYKGLDVLLLAFERLLQRQTGIPYRLLVAGSLRNQSWDQSVYGGLCRSLRIADAVQVEQSYIPLNDFGIYFEASDAVCLPYRSASQSGALQLAYSYRKPVVASAVGSIPESVVHGQTGLLVPPEDPDALAGALHLLLGDLGQCRQMGEEAYRWAGDERSWDSIAQQTLALYQELEAAA